ncbi:MAG TPA: A24 family peptidase C-terminal domain-containing protein [Candidatus Thermoplasmatota archaeon]|nr:A24 family peptidase C-terminal domain-containing protein [Candidatus Thermoplasmatota archaeon]
MESLDLLRLVIGSGFLFHAAVLDVRTRRVPNGVWVGLASCGGLLFVVDLAVTGRFDWVHVVIAAGVAALAYALWFFHLLAGGADAKALMALGVLLPARIEWDWVGRALPAWDSPMPGALVVLGNSLVLFSLAPLALLAYNLVRADLRFPTMFLGYTMPRERAAAEFVWIVDRVDASGRRRQALFPSRTSDEDYVANLDRLRAAGVERVWVTPKIPFMLPLLFGFIAAFLLGDILFHLVARIVLGRDF